MSRNFWKGVLYGILCLTLFTSLNAGGLSAYAEEATQQPTSAVEYASHKTTWYAKWDPSDTPANTKGVGTIPAKWGLAHAYPQHSTLKALIKADGLKCGDRYTTQTDFWVGLKGEIKKAKAWTLLWPGQDSHLFEVVAGWPKAGLACGFPHTAGLRGASAEADAQG